jgi:hypothetical protein
MDCLKVGRSGVLILASATEVLFSKTMQTGSGADPTSYAIGTGFFPRGKVAGAWNSPLTSTVPRLYYE